MTDISTEIDCSEDVAALRHGALRNALYHSARRGWLDGWTKILNLLIILGGTGSAAQLVQKDDTWTLILGLAIASFGAIQLVFDLAGRARLHGELQRRYYLLLADIDGSLHPGKADCAAWTAVDGGRMAA